MAHPNYDEWWQARTDGPHLKKVHAAVMTVGGWFDAEDLYGTFKTYRETERLNPGITNVLVMGPWSHGGWARSDGDRLGNVPFDAKTSLYYREHFELPFFKHYLKDPEKEEASRPRGDARPRSSTSPKRTSSKRARTSGGISMPGRRRTRPKSRCTCMRAAGCRSIRQPATATTSFDEYVSDPAKPVPYIDSVAIERTTEYMDDDQRFAATRPDVLVYQTDELTEDVTLAGPLCGATAGFDIRHRFRFRRQADRRVLGRLSQPRSQSDGRARWAATSSWCAAN